MKPCKTCGIEKPLEQYYKHSQMADGHLNKCIECVKARVMKYRGANIERVRLYDRIRGRGEDRKRLVRERQKAKLAAHNEYTRKWGTANRRKRYAHVLVYRAVNKGVLVRQPCEVCGDVKSQAHHDDYGKPLDVRWLCNKHHKEHHRKF